MEQSVGAREAAASAQVAAQDDGGEAAVAASVQALHRGRGTRTAERKEKESAEHHKAPQQHKREKQERVGEKDKGGDKPPTSSKRARTRTPQRVEPAVAEERSGSSFSGGDTGGEGSEVTWGGDTG